MAMPGTASGALRSYTACCKQVTLHRMAAYRHVQLVLRVQPPLRLHGGLQLVDVHVQGHRLQLMVTSAHARVASLCIQHAGQDRGPLLDPLPVQLKVLLCQPAPVAQLSELAG